MSTGIKDEPAFAWWVPYTLHKRKQIISKLKSKYWSRTHKYGIQIPKSYAEAREIDKENSNTLWQDAIAKELKNVRVAFELYEGNPEELIGYEQVTVHMIYDVKLDEKFR